MNTEDTIVNKVANSSLINIDLEDYYPKGKRVQIDLAETLFQGLILREKDFRDWIKTHDWSQYKDAYVAVACSADAIIPVWAYMLVSAQLEPFAKDLVFVI
jgi:S-adenosylmethionine/arginine decarboxylase-like enzyme